MTHRDDRPEVTLLDEWREALEEAAQHYDPAAHAHIISEVSLEVVFADDTPLWQVCIDAAGRMLVEGIQIDDASTGLEELVHIQLPDRSKRHEVRVG